MKKCSKCGIEKELSDFSKGRNQCRDCKKELAKEYRKENPEYQKEYRKENAEKLKEYNKEYSKGYRKENRETISGKLKNKRLSNISFFREREKSYYEASREYRIYQVKNYQARNSKKIKEYRHERYLEHKVRLNMKRKNWRKDNPEKHKSSVKRRHKERSQSDINYRVRINLRARLRMAIKNGTKSAKTLDLLGCTIDFLKTHLKNQFTKGMSWGNYGLYGWHIDHIIPCASFDMESPEQQKICFNYRNLQPLWAKDNLGKGSKLPPNPQTSLPI